MASDGFPQPRTRLSRASETARALAALPDVAAVVPLGLGEAETVQENRRPASIAIVAAGHAPRRIWTIVAGGDLGDAEDDVIVVNEALATRLGATPGSTVDLRGRCSAGPSVRPPVRVRIAGTARFPFESADGLTAGSRFALLERLCEERADEADLLLVASRDEAGPDAAVDAIRRARPDLSAFSNDEVIERFERVGFSYFRQISAALAIVTVSFGVVLITVLLTVSVNQRLGEIAALRAIGFSRRRAAMDVLWESVLLVGIGGAAAIPLGLVLAVWLDAILRSLPGVPATLHFFVFEPRALWLQVALLAAVALGASVYPMWLVARLPIAATLRREFVS
jgi:putative ABC transport system permease protein